MHFFGNVLTYLQTAITAHGVRVQGKDSDIAKISIYLVMIILILCIDRTSLHTD
jgi:hypothetical protein